jgi:hypothetical protein
MNKKLILSVGMPRAGTGWFYNITQTLVIAAGGINSGEIRNKYHLSKLLTEVNCNIGTINAYRILSVISPLLFEPNYVIKLHAGRKSLADMLISIGLIKPTFIYRDPRDAALSIYEYGQEAITNPTASNAFSGIRTVEEAIDFISPYIDFAKGWIQSDHTFSVKYETLLSEFDLVVPKLVEFLDINLDADHALTLVEHFKAGQNKTSKKLTHFMKGKVGRYLEHFSAEQIELCNERFGPFLVEQGYQET